MQQPKRWWIGLPLLAGLIYFAAQALTGDIEADLTERASATLAGLGAGVLENPGVSVSGRDIVFTGRAVSAEGPNEATAALRRLNGARVATDGSSLPERISPYLLTLKRSEGRVVVIEGHVPSGGAREKLKSELKKQGLQVEDRSAYGLGAPLGFEEFSRFAARQIAKLESGVVTLDDKSIAIAGAAPIDADLDALVAAARDAPQGAEVAVAIGPPLASPYFWSAQRAGEKIELRGFAPLAGARSRLAAKAKAIFDGAEVVDSTRIARGAPDDFLSAAETALSQLRALASGAVSLADNVLSISGEGKANVSAAGLAAETARNLPAGFAIAAVNVKDGPVSPYLFSASAREGALTLSGHAPDEATQGEILAAAKRDFAKLALSDAVSPARGAPAEFARAAAAGLAALARLESGGLAISDETVALTGVARPGEAAEIEEGLKTALPKNFKPTLTLSEPPVAEPSSPSASVAPAATPGGADLQGALDAQLKKSPIRFTEPKDGLSPENGAAVVELAGLLRRAGDQAVEIIGHSPEPDIEEIRRTVAKRRAQAVADRLIELGVEAERLSVSGVAPNENLAAPHIEVKVKTQ